MNIVALAGRVANDINYKQNGNNTYARFSIAVQRKIKNKDGGYDADFINCVAFDKTADFLAKYFKKGMRINIQGHMQSGSYVNQQNVKVYTLDVIVDSAEFGESKNAINEIPRSDDGFMNIPEEIEEELPFN